MDENNLTQAQYNLLKERENLLKTKDKLSTLGMLTIFLDTQVLTF